MTKVREALEHLEGATRYNEWVADWIRGEVGQDFIEIGAGLGSLSFEFLDRERIHLVDLDPEHVAYMTERFRGEDRVSTGVLDVGDPAAVGQLGRTFDTVIMSNVLEHIEEDRRALENCATLLRPGGHLILVVPSHPVLFGTLDVSVGHHRRYGADLAARLTACGYKVLRTTFHNRLGAFGWYLHGRILRTPEISPGSVRMFERLLPLVKVFDQVVRLPFGQSMVVVAERP